MPYPSPIFRCNINAVINGDSMVHTVWMKSDPTVIQERTPTQIAEKVRDTWQKYILGGNNGSTSMTSRYSNTTIWSNVQAYQLDVDGKATDLGEAPFPSTVKGAGTTTLPGQVALCVTLLTGGAGRSRRGRLYLGGFGATNMLETNGRVIAGATQAVADNIAKFYTELRNENGGDLYRPVVVSPTLGIARKITSVQVGDVWDTMRSRRKARGEARVGAVVDAS